MFRIMLLTFLIGFGHQVNAGAVSGEFPSIDGGTISLEEWRGGPVLVVNTASRCGFTHQYDDLQALYDRYRKRGFQLLAVPSNDFKQELATAEEVKDFCAVNFDLDLPMTEITHVRGANGHPFYKQVREATGFVPRWNFNKILIGPDGEVVKTWRSRVNPLSDQITGEIEALLQ
ncbi:glutathione peroxidase [Aliiruegeria lutimaris]|uniref:Glutathione peroxidase n=1 Tax=Aliiruegeria lutimaris TaxID=571298 RepID=A0A1G8QP90_9RHOB|nr:glutathione peroxidase [Aliiruegeria lutimaris]SDJ06506.1 glutathione peroxidase [Aliiruegeria lutimaris]